MVRIFAFSDFHGEHELFPEITRRAKEADIVICAGDLTWFEEDVQELLSFLNSWNKPVLMIHGNHEGKKMLKKACEHFQNITFCHGKAIEFAGVTFLAWGGGGFARIEPELAFLTKEWESSKNPRFLITHAPPRDTALDIVDHRHVGCQTVNECILKLKPVVAVSGHIHDSAEAEEYIDTSHCVNLGPWGRTFEL